MEPTTFGGVADFSSLGTGLAPGGLSASFSPAPPPVGVDSIVVGELTAAVLQAVLLRVAPPSRSRLFSSRDVFWQPAMRLRTSFICSPSSPTVFFVEPRSSWNSARACSSDETCLARSSTSISRFTMNLPGSLPSFSSSSSLMPRIGRCCIPRGLWAFAWSARSRTSALIFPSSHWWSVSSWNSSVTLTESCFTAFSRSSPSMG
mmetsp:Transcript_58137/g.164167  ORF Transcript_58137/g.164167 Transcript_58137/m.164167 type:complete len:204 (+) Transcript_58137:194-805(+)